MYNLEYCYSTEHYVCIPMKQQKESNEVQNNIGSLTICTIELKTNWNNTCTQAHTHTHKHNPNSVVSWLACLPHNQDLLGSVPRQNGVRWALPFHSGSCPPSSECMPVVNGGLLPTSQDLSDSELLSAEISMLSSQLRDKWFDFWLGWKQIASLCMSPCPTSI